MRITKRLPLHAFIFCPGAFFSMSDFTLDRKNGGKPGCRLFSLLLPKPPDAQDTSPPEREEGGGHRPTRSSPIKDFPSRRSGTVRHCLSYHQSLRRHGQASGEYVNSADLSWSTSCKNILRSYPPFANAKFTPSFTHFPFHFSCI